MKKKIIMVCVEKRRDNYAGVELHEDERIMEKVVLLVCAVRLGERSLIFNYTFK